MISCSSAPASTFLQASEVIDKIQIIGGLEKGNITKAQAGKHVGAVIYKYMNDLLCASIAFIP